MAWEEDNYLYSIPVLEQIAECYRNIYDGLEFYSRTGFCYGLESNPISIAEYKADFDIARKKLVETSEIEEWVKNDLANYLLGKRVYKPRQAFREMKKILNGEE